MLANAASGAQMEMLSYLLEKGADVNAADKNGMTALHWAAHNHDAAMVSVLTTAGAKPNSRATIYKRGHSESSVSAYMHFPYEGAPLHWALGGKSVYKTAHRAGPAPDVLATVKALLDAGADPKLATEGGRKPLELPVTLRDRYVLRLLLERGADPTEVRVALLHIAVANDDCETVKLLIEKGCDINKTASPASSWEPIDELVGKRVTFASGKSATPLQRARSDRMRQLLRDAGAHE